MNTTSKIYLMIRELLESDTNLNEWEESFLLQIERLLESDTRLSERQLSKVRQIYESKILCW